MKIFRQKSYSIFQELYHSGASRVKKKYLGRLRRGIAEGAEKFTRGQAAKNAKLNKALDSGELGDISNPELARKIIREGREKGDVRVFDNNKFSRIIGGKGGNYNRPISKEESLDFKNQSKNRRFNRQTKKVLDSLINRKNIVNLKGDYKDNVAVLAHEIGHAMNNTGSAGKKNVAISRLDTIKRNTPLRDKGIIDIIKNRLVILKEESNAWKNGLDLLKKNGATKDELKIAKRKKDAALGTYKSNSLYIVGKKLFKKYSPEGINKNIGTNPSSVSKDKERMFKILTDRFDTIPEEEIKKVVDGMKTDRQLYRQQKKRKAKRKDKNILKEMFGNW